MPLVTELKRNGERVKESWSWWHLNAFCDAMAKEGVPANERLNRMEDYTFTQEHQYADFEENIWSAGERGKMYRFTIQAGDKFMCWRSF